MPTVVTPQIAWHGRDAAGGKNDPILSVDVFVSPTTKRRNNNHEATTTTSRDHGDGVETNEIVSHVVATGGADNCVRLWRLAIGSKTSVPSEAATEEKKRRNDDDPLTTTFLVSLEGHSATVNCVRFCPNGEFLASGSDDYRVLLWRRNAQKTDESWTWSDVRNRSQVLYKMLSGHKSDIYALHWSPNGSYVASGSTDNTVTVWDARRGKRVDHFDGHSHYVQGLAWDPRDQFLVSSSCDKTCRVFGRSNENRLCPDVAPVRSKGRAKAWKSGVRCLQKIVKMQSTPSTKSVENDRRYENVAESSTRVEAENGSTARKTPSTTNMFLDETVPSFFRRLAFTPDGSACLIPTGRYNDAQGKDATPCTFLFRRNAWRIPAVAYRTVSASRSESKNVASEPSVAVRCSPILYRMRTDHPHEPVLQLPYRMVFAVATLSNVILYDTQQLAPLGIISNVHYAQLTDLSWSEDGRFLIISSQDGYCSVVAFAKGELGEEIPEESVPSFMKRAFRTTIDDEEVDATAETSSSPKRSREEDEGTSDAKSSVSKCSDGPTAQKKKKKRATLIALAPDERPVGPSADAIQGGVDGTVGEDESTTTKKRAMLISLSPSEIPHGPSEAFA